MSGMNKASGLSLEEDIHIRQSVHDILTTPIGSRIKRRTYGSMIPDLIAQPMNPATRLRLMAATVMAIIQWEPRLAVSSTTLEIGAEGQSTIDIEATRRSGQRTGSPINLAIPLR